MTAPAPVEETTRALSAPELVAAGPAPAATELDPAGIDRAAIDPAAIDLAEISLVRVAR